MAFFYDFGLDQLTHYAQTYKIAPKGARRKKISGDQSRAWEIRLHRLVLQTFTRCFVYDKDNDFIDSNKFDKLVDPLVNQIDCIGLQSDYAELVNDYVYPAILQLFELTKDDYKWKTLGYAILMKTRSEIAIVRLNAIRLVLRVVDQLKERSAVLINDLLPFLSEALEDEDIEVRFIEEGVSC